MHDFNNRLKTKNFLNFSNNLFSSKIYRKNNLKTVSDIEKKLYGRDKEINNIKNIFNDVNKDNSERIIISGYSGIGKSVLIEKLYYDNFKDNSFFIHGKFDQFDKNIPYKAIIQAFQDITEKLLKKNSNDLQLWKKEFFKALGQNSQVIINFIPSLEQIVGKQPKLPELGPIENQNRFNLFFQEFLKVFSRTKKPLVLFLDDLQWADIASLNIIKLIISNLEIKNFLFIGTYRNNEVDDNHPLQLILNELKNNKINVNKIILKALNLSDVYSIIADSLKCNYNEILDLGNIIYKKTGGNPFYINEFLKSLYQDKILQYVPENNKIKKNKKKNKVWIWDIKKISDKKVTDNVADLFIGRITTFLINTQELIKLAACIGSRFDLRTLSIIYNKSENETFSDFASIIKEGLLFYVEGYYTFVHDKIQEAVYSLIDKEEKKKIHYKIGNALLKKNNEKELEKNIFFIADQFNDCFEIITEKKDKIEILKLFISAGIKAKESTAYQSAMKYLETAINFLDETSWNNQYDITLSLYTHTAECAYLSASYNLMNKYIETVLCNGKKLLDKVKVYEIKIQSYFAQNKVFEAVDLSKTVLKKLGIYLPKNPKKIHVVTEGIKNNFLTRGKSIDYFKNLPKMTDLNKLAAIRIMSSTGTAAYYAVPYLLPLMIVKIINIALKYGNSPESPFYYSAYGLLCKFMGDVSKGYKFCKFAIELLEYFDNYKLYAKVHLVFHAFISYMKNHLKKTLEPLQKVYKIGLEVGDKEYATLGAMIYCANLFFSGTKLSFVDSESTKYYNFLKEIKQEKTIKAFELGRQIVIYLRGFDKCRIDALGKKFDEDKIIKELKKTNDNHLIGAFYSHKLIYSYLFYNYIESLINIKKCKQYIGALRNLYSFTIFYFYYSLTLLDLYLNENLINKIKYSFIIRKNQRKMKKWAKYSPMNFLHKYCLVEAELSRINGKLSKAIKLYEKSISLASEHGFINEAALANELAAKFYLSINKIDNVKKHITKAYYLYLEWEADTKAQHLEKNYTNLINYNLK